MAPRWLQDDPNVNPRWPQGLMMGPPWAILSHLVPSSPLFCSSWINVEDNVPSKFAFRCLHVLEQKHSTMARSIFSQKCCLPCWSPLHEARESLRRLQEGSRKTTVAQDSSRPASRWPQDGLGPPLAMSIASPRTSKMPKAAARRLQKDDTGHDAAIFGHVVTSWPLFCPSRAKFDANLPC